MKLVVGKPVKPVCEICNTLGMCALLSLDMTHYSISKLCYVDDLFFFLSTTEAAIPSFKDQCLKWHNEFRKRHQVIWELTTHEHVDELCNWRVTFPIFEIKKIKSNLNRLFYASSIIVKIQVVNIDVKVFLCKSWGVWLN